MPLIQQVMNIRETILKRIKDLRKGEEEVCFGHNVKQEEKLSDFRMNVMQILLELVKIDASSIENLRKVGDDLVKFRGVISAEVRGSKPFDRVGLCWDQKLREYFDQKYMA